MPATLTRRLVTLADAADALAVSTRTVRSYIADGQLEARKLPGRAHTDNVVLRRGITGDLDLYRWWDAVRNGEPNTQRTVTIALLSEDRATVALTWRLLRAWPAAISFGPLRGLGQEVAIESLELAYERLELE